MRKKSFLFTIISIIILVVLVIPDSRAEYVCGDANEDGVLNVSDAVFIINHVFLGGPAPDIFCCFEFGCPSTVTDYDGNVYNTVQIGNQCWMQSNLKAKHYRNGDPISREPDPVTWANLTTGAYCTYDTDPANAGVYGHLYNWYAVNDTRGLAPAGGWHVPSDDEWKTLERYLGMSYSDANLTGSRGTDEGGQLKEAGTIHWQSPNTGATNSSDFTALPGGWRSNFDGAFGYIGYIADFWTATENAHDLRHANRRALLYDDSRIYRCWFYKESGYSVRCVKNIFNIWSYICGDANMDGFLNISDAVFIINYVFIDGPAPDSTCCEPDRAR